ncbi:MAG TPA: oxidoreductase, partial [Candidatus Omnitrophota bacterium]|nr:oxidoreductase [Candidatus Omnitrophota bacterium]
MLHRKTFFIREHVGFIKLTDTYDILDPETREQLGVAKEKPAPFIQVLRLLINKQLLPTKVFVYEGADHEDENRLLFSIQRGVTLLRSRVNIYDGRGTVIGWLKSKV